MPAKDRNELTISSKAKCDRYRGHANPQRKIKCYGVTDTQILRITFTTKEEFDEMLAKGVQPWAGAGVKTEEYVDMAIERGAYLITCNNPDEILEWLRKKGCHE